MGLLGKLKAADGTGWIQKPVGHSDAAQWVADPVRASGVSVLKFHIEKGWEWSGDAGRNPPHDRCEAIIWDRTPDVGTKYAWRPTPGSTTYWECHGIRWRTDQLWPQESVGNTYGEEHSQTNDDSVSPNKHYFGEKRLAFTDTTQAGFRWGSQKLITKQEWLDNRGKWFHAVTRIFFASDGSGSYQTKVYLNGVLWKTGPTVTGATMGSSNSAINRKIGLYRVRPTDTSRGQDPLDAWMDYAWGTTEADVLVPMQDSFGAGGGGGGGGGGGTPTQLATPTNLQTSSGNGFVDMSCSTVAPISGGGAVRYQWVRDDVALAITTVPSYRDTAVVNGTTYAYTVGAIDDVPSHASQTFVPQHLETPAATPSGTPLNNLVDRFDVPGQLNQAVWEFFQNVQVINGEVVFSPLPGQSAILRSREVYLAAGQSVTFGPLTVADVGAGTIGQVETRVVLHRNRVAGDRAVMKVQKSDTDHTGHIISPLAVAGLDWNGVAPPDNAYNGTTMAWLRFDVSADGTVVTYLTSADGTTLNSPQRVGVPGWSYADHQAVVEVECKILSGTPAVQSARLGGINAIGTVTPPGSTLNLDLPTGGSAPAVGDVLCYQVTADDPASVIANLGNLPFDELSTVDGSGISDGTHRQFLLAARYDPRVHTGDFTLNWDRTTVSSCMPFVLSGADSLATDYGITDVKIAIDTAGATSHQAAQHTTQVANVRYYALAAADTEGVAGNWGAAPAGYTRLWLQKDTGGGVGSAAYVKTVANIGTVVQPTLPLDLSLPATIISFYVRPGLTSAPGGFVEPVNAKAPAGATQAIADPAFTPNNYYLLNTDLLITMPTPAAGEQTTIELQQDGVGGHAVTWAGTIDWLGGSAPAIAGGVNARTVITAFCLDGVSWIAGALSSTVPLSTLQQDTAAEGDRLVYTSGLWTPLSTYEETPADHNMFGWAGPPDAAQGGQAPTAGYPRFIKVKCAKGGTVNFVWVVVVTAGTGATALANVHVDVYRSTGVKIGTSVLDASANDPTIAFATAGSKKIPITVVGGQSLVVARGEIIRVGLLVGTQSTTNVTLRALAAADGTIGNVGQTAGGFDSGGRSSNPASTTLPSPADFSTSGAGDLAATGTKYWVGVSSS